MPFMLRDVGLECYTLVYRGEDIGAVFSTDDDDDDAQPWVATLRTDRFRSASEFPPPFTSASRRFTNFQDLRDWLGITTPALSAIEVAA